MLKVYIQIRILFTNNVVLGGRKFRVQYSGNITLPNGICLKDVLYVPQVHFNYIYVHELVTQLKCIVIFYSNSV